MVEHFNDSTTQQIENCNHTEDPLPDYPLYVEDALANVISGQVTVCGGRHLITLQVIDQWYKLNPDLIE